ncbi:unnamed protein product [Rotaria magnacalcarata]|uniref:Uncharacterized protein n=5 Tax=Rotaria magnacalcarata TaxID=392030 RepID=A0A816S857_9BILA|nr:unnamed protein product [Rotaria magnacalcarata]CAF1315737.1 unnamed protein product [Rotaria magnacalcarata]CAF2080658.1 unnamed protein product [Rotaria magnacalcarata]CAF2200784.1 unnamed protein product [Rotaria magnacalcarata]CAF2256098.1 unnamed protein product [Rotaria magnacalcarata]
MGIIFSSKIRQICSPYDERCARVIIVGLDSAGKTTLVRRFKNIVDLQLDTHASYIEHIVTEPTFVYEIETVYPRLAPLALNLWDLGGEEKTRELWRFYLTGIQGVVFVIDCHDGQRIQLARKELLDLSKKLDGFSFIPIVIAANKQDLPQALRKEELLAQLSLGKTRTEQWKVFEMSAHTGGGVMEMFSYLSQVIHRKS